MSVSDAAYELMDELFFMITFQDLVRESGFGEKEIEPLIKELLEAGWVNQLHIPPGEQDFTKLDVPDLENFPSYSYLATKKGLLAYNGIE